MSLFLCHPPFTRPAACGRSRRTSSPSGSSARRGGLEEARLVNLARQSSVFPVLWQAIPVMIRLQRGCWATSRRRRSRRALQVCVSCTCFSCCVCTISQLCLSLLKAFIKTNSKSLNDGPVTSFCSTRTCCCYMKRFSIHRRLAELVVSMLC